MITSNEPAAPAFDRETALSRVGGDEELLREICEIFLQECAPAIAGLKTAVADRNPKGIERQAHSIKGSISTFGSGAAFRAALELETKGRTGNLVDVDSTMERFEESLECLRLELEQVIQE